MPRPRPRSWSSLQHLACEEKMQLKPREVAKFLTSPRRNVEIFNKKHHNTSIEAREVFTGMR